MIGASPLRKEDRRLLLGQGRFVDDLPRQGLLHLGIVRSVQGHARIVRIDLSAAARMPGVRAAWAPADLPEIARPIPAVFGGSFKGKPFAQPVLAGDVVRYVGECVAAVVADDPYALADALETVRVEYGPLPPVTSPEDAQRSAARLHEGWTDNIALTARGAVGDAERGLGEADLVIHEIFHHPRLAAVPMETRGVLAYRAVESDTLVIWTSHQNPYRVRDAVATVLGRPAERVRVMIPDTGGGFGPKGQVYPEEIIVAAAALRTGRPVKWVGSRREDLAALGPDREQVHEIRAGFRRDGTLVAVDDAMVADAGAYPVEGDNLTMNTINHLASAYRLPHYRGVCASVVTNKMPGAAYRGAGRPEACFVMERVMDLAARRLALDPAEIRRRNLVRPEEMPYKPGLVYKDGVPIAMDPGDFPAALERALGLIGYKDWRARQSAARHDVRRIGIGISCYAQGTGLGPYESATVRVDPSGKVYVVIGVAAQGQGHATTLAQIAADELGASFEDVVVVAGDTSLVPFGMGTGGSRVTANSGPAVARTAREVRERAARVAAELLECAPADVRIENSHAYVAGMPSRTVPLGRIAHVAIRSKALKPVGEPGLNACTYFYPDTVTWAFGTQVVVVEVDPETFQVRLLAFAGVHDPGRAINPMIVEAQLQGGIVQGIGAGLFEEIVYDAGGQLLTGSLMDYAIPRADELPAILVGLDEHRSVINDLGVKGVGESGCIPGAGLIANAVEDAIADLGVTLRDAPVTPRRIFEARAARTR